MTDAELVRATLAGSRDAYAEIARRWAPRVTAICHSRVRKADVAQRKVSNVSVMPEGLQTGLTPQQFADLIAYLQTLKDKPVETPKPPANAANAPASGKVVFPAAISLKYSSEDAGMARMHTCVDQYIANKETNANGSMKWVQKGGGYYFECNKRFKGL